MILRKGSSCFFVFEFWSSCRRIIPTPNFTRDILFIIWMNFVGVVIEFARLSDFARWTVSGLVWVLLFVVFFQFLSFPEACETVFSSVIRHEFPLHRVFLARADRDLMIPTSLF
jgi:hypothetical protein